MKYKTKKVLIAFSFVVPLLVGITIFTVAPFIMNIYYSFTDLGAFGVFDWIGLENYKNLFSDNLFWQSIKNTFIYVLAAVPITIFFSIVLSWMLNKITFMKNFFKSIYFLPVITMSAASSLVFKWLFDSKYGLINSILDNFGLGPYQWIGNGDLTRIVIIIFIIWQGLGEKIIILLGGLQSISKSYVEAAQIDGANERQIFFKITIPLLSPSIFYICIVALIGAFQIFDVIYMIVPHNTAAYEKTITVVRYFYDKGFQLGDKGYASAIACVLFVIIMIITLIQFKAQKKWVHY